MQEKTPDFQFLTDAQIEEMEEAYEADGKQEILKVLQKLKQERSRARRKTATADPIMSCAEEASASEPPAPLRRGPREESD